MPPVGAYVRPLSVTSERTTASFHLPPYTQHLAQSLQYFSVSRRACSGWMARGGFSCDGYQVKTNGALSLSAISNSAAVVKSFPRVSIGVRKTNAFGPAIASSPSPHFRTHGTTSP